MVAPKETDEIREMSGLSPHVTKACMKIEAKPTRIIAAQSKDKAQGDARRECRSAILHRAGNTITPTAGRMIRQGAIETRQSICTVKALRVAGVSKVPLAAWDLILIVKKMADNETDALMERTPTLQTAW